jgi:Domain of unknown function (DUF397)
MEEPVPDSLPAGIDPSTLDWRRPEVAAGGQSDGPPRASDAPDGDVEVAITPRAGGGNWVLLRVTGDPAGRILVYDEHEWECFLDGARKGEFGQF